jgi:glucose-6-phosphate 1-dehydrogenase
MVRTMVRKSTGLAASEYSSFLRLFTYVQGYFDERSGYEKLASLLGKQDAKQKTCTNKLFHLAVPPQYYKKIFKHLAHSGLTKACPPTPAESGWTRVVVEKPFGRDLATAQALDRLLGKLFKEEQIYRLDHYLGKETVQNVLAFRFSNAFLEPAWNRRHIERLDLRFWETDGVEDRGDFYDETGALRDVGQNHLLQLLALFTMNNPGTFTASAIRRERIKILRALKPLSLKTIPTHTMRAQYAGYAKLPEVAARSTTETYFRITAELDNPNWRGVPITMEGGKRLPEDNVEVAVTFKHHTPCLCPPDRHDHYQNVLRYRLRPSEGVVTSFWVKKPGTAMVIEEKELGFNYRSAYAPEEFIDAYEKLILDAMAGDQTLFVSTEEIEASWRFIDPIVRAWKHKKSPLIFYQPQTLPRSSP